MSCKVITSKHYLVLGYKSASHFYRETKYLIIIAFILWSDKDLRGTVGNRTCHYVKRGFFKEACKLFKNPDNPLFFTLFIHVCFVLSLYLILLNIQIFKNNDGNEWRLKEWTIHVLFSNICKFNQTWIKRIDYIW